MEYKIPSKNKTSMLLTTVFLIMNIIFLGCKSDSEMVIYPSDINNDNKKAFISGQVIDQDTGLPIDSALIRIFGNKLNVIFSICDSSSDGK
jgi:hypothetical protein